MANESAMMISVIALIVAAGALGFIFFDNPDALDLTGIDANSNRITSVESLSNSKIDILKNEILDLRNRISGLQTFNLSGEVDQDDLDNLEDDIKDMEDDIDDIQNDIEDIIDCVNDSKDFEEFRDCI